MPSSPSSASVTSPTASTSPASCGRATASPGQPAWVFVDADGSTDVVSGALGEAAIAERLDALVG